MLFRERYWLKNSVFSQKYPGFRNIDFEDFPAISGSGSTRKAPLDRNDSSPKSGDEQVNSRDE